MRWLMLLTVTVGLVGIGNTEPIQVPTQTVQAEAPGYLTVDLQFPGGYHLNPRAPFTYAVGVTGKGIVIPEPYHKVRTSMPSLPVRIPFQASSAGQQALVDVDMTFAYCRDDDTGVCVIQSVRWLVSLHAEARESQGPEISYKVETPQLQKNF